MTTPGAAKAVIRSIAMHCTEQYILLKVNPLKREKELALAFLTELGQIFLHMGFLLSINIKLFASMTKD